MKLSKHFLIPLTLAAVIPLAAQAHAGGRCHGGPSGPQAMLGEEMGPMPGGHRGDGMMMPFMRGLNLSETQQDQIFKLMHDQAPALREKAKEMHKANAELHALGFSPNYSEARAKALSETSAQAGAQLAQMRTANANRIYQLLTPEQRQKMEEMKTSFEPRGLRRAPPPAEASPSQR